MSYSIRTFGAPIPIQGGAQAEGLMLPANLTPIEVIDMGICCESLAHRMYDALARRIEIPTVQARLVQLKKDEKDHRKTLRAHRRALFGSEPPAVEESEAASVFGPVDPPADLDRDAMIQALYGAIRYEEYSAYFYEKMRYKMPSDAARIFFEVLASEGAFHAEILKEQIETLRALPAAAF